MNPGLVPKLEFLTVRPLSPDTSFDLSAWEDGPGRGRQEQPQPCCGYAHQSREILRLERGKKDESIKDAFAGVTFP